MRSTIFFAGVLVLFLSACKSSTNKQAATASNQNQEKSTATSSLPSSSGNTLFSGVINDKPFGASHEVFANKIPDGNYYAIHASTNEYGVTLHIPIDKSSGSFTCEGSFTDKQNDNKLYNADAAAVTIEEKNQEFIAGSFTLLATDQDGNIQSVNDGRFKALIK